MQSGACSSDMDANDRSSAALYTGLLTFLDTLDSIWIYDIGTRPMIYYFSTIPRNLMQKHPKAHVRIQYVRYSQTIKFGITDTDKQTWTV